MNLSLSGCAMIQLSMIFAPPTGMSVVAAFATVSSPAQAPSNAPAAVAAVASAAPRSRLRRTQAEGGAGELAVAGGRGISGLGIRKLRAHGSIMGAPRPQRH